jgi:hypothetical protein
MAHTDKDMPMSVQLGVDEDGYTKWRSRPRRKKHAKLLRNSHTLCGGGIHCCGSRKSPRTEEKRVWKKEVLISLS